MCRLAAIAAIAVVASIFAGGATPSRATPATSRDPIARAFSAVSEDTVPTSLNHKHYVVSNENGIPLFKPHIANLGGVYIGVGTDQNYMMAGWARPDVLVLLDYDRMVVAVHDIYRALFLAHDTPAGFMTGWVRREKVQTVGLLKRIYASQPERQRRALEAFDYSRRAINTRLKWLRAQSKYIKGKRNFTTDVEDYRHLRRLWLDGRVRVIAGDLMGHKAIKGLVAAARETKLPVRLLYLSNAEQYQGKRYDPQFVANMLAMPFDERSIVLRTMPRPPRGLRYWTQRGTNFHAWLSSPKTRSVWSFLRLGAAKKDRKSLLLRHIYKEPRRSRPKPRGRAPAPGS